MSKKGQHQEALQHGLVRLRQAGIVPEEISPASVPFLQRELGKGYETDLAVIFLLGRIADPAVPELLSSLEKNAGDKEIRKEIRRSLFKLAQKGLHARRDEGAAAGTSAPLLAMGPAMEGYLSSVDGAGGRLIWIAKPEAGRGIQLLQGMVSDRIGLVHVGGAQVRRRELRQMAQEIKQSHDVTMIPIPWEYADLILYEGFEKAKASGRGELEQFLSLRAAFNLAKPKPLPHPVYGRLDAEACRDAAWRELSHRLLDESDFRAWILDEDLVNPYLAQVAEAQQSRLVLSQLQKEERFASIVRDAVREIFFGADRAIFQRRMEDMALYLLETQRMGQAKLALAVAVELGKEEPGPLDISFLTGWMQKSLAFYLGRAKQKAAEEPSLIVKP